MGEAGGVGEWAPHWVWQCGVQTRQSQCDLSLNTGADGSEDNELGLGMGLVQDGFLLDCSGKRVREVASVSGQAVATG